jgi:crotonobetainyl-CoA:carnitine CoA-transferase CaiB-like acyl-CoA transferase
MLGHSDALLVPMTASALDGLRVLELTSGVSAAYAGKLLADLGADVVMIEPPGGTPLREHVLFDYLAGGKQSAVPHDDVDFVAWLHGADVVLSDGTSHWHQAATAGLPAHAVLVDVSPFGRSGPYADWASSDLVTWAMGGYLSFTGSPDREPIWLPGPQAALHAGTHAAIAALAALHDAERTGEGQSVEVSELEATLVAHAWLVTTWAANGRCLERQPSDLIRARDGWVYVMRIVPKDEMFVMIDRPDLAEENLTADLPTWNANIPRIFEAVAEWAADKTVAEIVEFGQLLRIAVTPVLDGAGVLVDDQLAARDWWEREGAIAFPGQPYNLSATPARRRGPAPAVDAHEPALAPAQAAAPAASSAPAASNVVPATDARPGRAPLEGVRIIEVTTNWAGPVAGRFLADLGADSIKVEWATRPATRALVWVGPHLDLQRQPYHRALYFNEMNRNKRGVCLDLGKPDGRAAFLELVKTADVVLENNSARVMPNLRLGYEELRAVNPAIIMVSMSGYGADGPKRDWVAYGANIETTSSLTSITGYPDGQLSRTTLFYADPVSGNYAALAILAALRHRARTGEGQWVEMALNESGVISCAEALIDYQRTGELRRPDGNRDPRVAPQGVYRCIGTDNWLALTVRSAPEWRALAEVIGRPDLAADESLADLEGRRARHDELDAAIGAWTAGLEQYEAAEALQSRGVPAAPVLANWQVLPNPHIHERGLYQTVLYPVVGAYPATTWPWRLSRTPARIARPAPLFAQHNAEVFQEAGLDDGVVAALYASGATADEPTPAG